MVCSPDDNTDFFDSVAGVWQGDTFAPFFLIHNLPWLLTTNLNGSNERKRLHTKKDKKAKDKKEMIPRQNYYSCRLCEWSNVCNVHANTPAQAESLLHSLEQTAKGIGFYRNSDKTELCFNQCGAASSLNGKPLKWVNLGSTISSTESDVNLRIGKAWTAIDRLSTK